jgi:hypothetical protein
MSFRFFSYEINAKNLIISINLFAVNMVLQKEYGINISLYLCDDFDGLNDHFLQVYAEIVPQTRLWFAFSPTSLLIHYSLSSYHSVLCSLIY